MNRKTEVAVLALGAVLLACVPGVAGTPQIAGISPAGVQRGVACEVTIGGANLAGNPPTRRARWHSGWRRSDPKRSTAGGWTVKLTVDPAVAVGVYPVRVQTDDGLSNPFLFAVGQLPQVAEKEDNSTFETAQVDPGARWSSRARPRATTSITSGSRARRGSGSSSTPSAPGSARASTRRSG